MGPVPRERYNARARQSQAGSHKRKKKSQAPVQETSADPNSLVHIPKTKEEKETDRKDKLKQELIDQSNSKWNSKKKKRLDKYIEKKLKKEERVQLFEKLSQSQAQIPSSLQLVSSATLGTGKPSTHQEVTEKLEDKEVRRALDGRAGKRKRHDQVFDVIDESDEDEESSLDEREDEDSSRLDRITTANAVKNDKAAETVVGGALKRDAHGNTLTPTVRSASQKKQKSVFASWKKKPLQQMEESDTSFDSSASEGEDEPNVGEDEDSAEDGDDSDDENTDGESSEEDDPPPKPKKSLGFKDWALKQLNIAKGNESTIPTPSDDILESTKTPPPPPAKKRKVEHSSATQPMRGPLGEDLQLPSTSFASNLQSNGAGGSKKPNVTISRPPEVEEARLLLPVVAEEQPIMEAILLNPVVIICGETGSGKTTQIPQFLYEAGFGTPGSEHPGMIGITQPRRVAAMSMAARVGHELSLTSSKVSYQIRYDATVSPDTSIKFMTDGVLLRELAVDFLLTKYSVIIIDEAHERSTNTDILIGVLSRVIKLREDIWKEGKRPLRLVIMSATLRVSDFAENQTLFASPPPVINVSARQHPVTVHFNRRTAADYVTEAIRKTIKIHTRLPPGGILVFLTGQNEINGICRKLEARFGKKALSDARKKRAPDVDTIPGGQSASRVGAAQADVEPEEMELGDSMVDNEFSADDEDEPEDPDALDSEEEQQLDEELGLDGNETESPMHVLPLYSLLPADRQMQVFEPPPTGSRLVVVCTNVAETSLTIPGIRYVVDCGRAKERHYDTSNGIQTFQVDWISKASSAQRAGRAGRTGPGHCYRLYSSALYEHYFQPFSQPEILRMPIEGVVLQMKAMNIDAVANFPFPTPPDRSSLRKAEVVLGYLGALDRQGQVTEQGRTMSLFPVSPRFSRMLVSGQQHGCLPYVIAIVSALSVGDPFLHEEALLHPENEEEEDGDEDLSHLNSEKVRVKEAARSRRKLFHSSQHIHSSLGKYSSDIFKMLSVVGAYEYTGGGLEFCKEHFVRLKAMEEVHKLRAQISAIVQSNFSNVDAAFVPNLQPPTDLQLKVLRQLLCAAFIDQVAIRKDRIHPSTAGAQYASSKNVPYRALGIGEDIFIHPSSVLANVPPPEYIVFTEVVRTSRVWVKGLTVVNPAWLSSLGKSSLCTYSKPFKNSSNIQMVVPHFGPDGWELPAVRAESVLS
ncbi:putative ATP-dependent RNA helicase DHR1 [Marasmius tenuissimus]|uniref:RNA helicase n=1 Tax=Marasmius tenuissimus TaxID=585030 RepID=A0ABR3A785_9AGAR